MTSSWQRVGAASMAAVWLVGSLAGCSTASKDIAPAYVSPLQYQSLDCTQLSEELRRVQSRVTELGGRLDTAASNDAALMGVGLILFWPALFALGGTKGQEAEYSRLRGEFEAIQQASVQKKCSAGTPATATPADKAAAAAASPAAAPAVPAAATPASSPR